MSFCARNFLIFSFFIPMFLFSCSDDLFRESSGDIYTIIMRSMDLQKVLDVKNIYDEKGNITATRTEIDSSKSKIFLQSKETEILEHYEILKSYTHKPNKFYYDAIFILSFFNELLDISSGQPIEDRCTYVRMIPTDKDVMLSTWVTDDLIGNLLYGGYSELEKKWRNLDYDEKYLYILHFLDSPTQKGRKCINLPNREKYTRFPPDDKAQ